MTQVTEPFPIFYDDDGTPLENGMIYIGQANQDPRTNPVTVYTDEARTIPIAQPIRTLDGRPAYQGAPTNLYISEAAYSITVQNRRGSPVVSAADVQSDFVTLSALAASGGSGLVGFIQSGTGAVARTVQDKLRDVVSVKDFGAVGDGVADDTAAIQAALDYAATFVILNDNTESQQSGGPTVFVPHGTFKITDTLVLEPGVSLVGSGRMASVIENTTTDKTLIRSGLGVVYNAAGSQIADLSLFGARTSTSQYGIDLLRWLNGVVRNVYAQNMGAGGYRLRQCICTTFDQVESHLSAGPGITTGQGINTWADTTLNNLPTNACVFVNCHMNRNDGAGILVGPYTNGCIFTACVSENNYFTAGANTGYNIELNNTNSFMPNEFVDVWCEGPVQAHVYMNATSDVTNRLTRLHHFGNGAAGNVDRAVIVNAGQLLIEHPHGHGGAYKTIAGSSAPFRLVKPNGIIYLSFPRGSTLSAGSLWVEDAAGAATGLENYLYQTGYGITRGNTQKYYMDSGAVAIAEWYRTGDSEPLLRVEPFYKALAFGDGGSSAPDAMIKRSGVRTLAMDTRGGAQFFDQGSAWDGNHILMGAYHLWVDATGALRIKNSAPTSDTDGTVVGTQT